MARIIQTPRRRQLAFTLIELLVVLVILGLLAGLVGPRVLKYLGSAKTDTAQLQPQHQPVSQGGTAPTSRRKTFPSIHGVTTTTTSTRVRTAITISIPWAATMSMVAKVRTLT